MNESSTAKALLGPDIKDPPMVTRPPKSPLRPDRNSSLTEDRPEWITSEFSSVSRSTSSCSSLSSLSSLASSVQPSDEGTPKKQAPPSQLATPPQTLPRRRNSHSITKPGSLGHSSARGTQEKLFLKIKDGASSTHYVSRRTIRRTRKGIDVEFGTIAIRELYRQRSIRLRLQVSVFPSPRLLITLLLLFHSQGHGSRHG